MLWGRGGGNFQNQIKNESVLSFYSSSYGAPCSPLSAADGKWWLKRSYGRPLVVKYEMATRWDDSGQHAGVLWVHGLHGHNCTYSSVINWVVEGGLLCHVVIRWRWRWHADRLPLESEQQVGGGAHAASWNVYSFSKVTHKIVVCNCLLCSTNIDPKNHRHDNCHWKKDSEGNIGSLNAIIGIGNCGVRTGTHTKKHYFYKILLK